MIKRWVSELRKSVYDEAIQVARLEAKIKVDEAVRKLNDQLKEIQEKYATECADAEAWRKESNRVSEERYEAQCEHARQVEGYLKGFNEILSSSARRDNDGK